MKFIILAILLSSCGNMFKFDEKEKGTLTGILCVEGNKAIVQLQTDKPIVAWYSCYVGRPVRLIPGRKYDLIFSSNDTAKVRRVIIKPIMK